MENNKSNAKKALSELLGLDNDTEKTEKMAEEIPEPTPVSQAYHVARPVSEERAPTTIISRDCEITGDIKTQGNLEIMGVVIGQLDCAGDVTIGTGLNGDVKCANLYLKMGKIRGNINARNDVVISAGTMQLGDISADRVTLAGKMKGDLTASGTAELQSSSVLSGNITASKIIMQDGCAVAGQIRVMPADFSEEKIFALTGEKTTLMKTIDEMKQ
jgi:cytoskeletal protein CcmA (bactofilin family)